MQLSECEKDTLAVLKYALNPDTEPPRLSAPWAEVEKELAAQTVEFIPDDVMGSLGLDGEETARYTMACAGNMRSFYKIGQEQERLAGLLESIPFAVLKGTGAAVYYPRPELRQMGDIDILVRPDNSGEAASTLEKAGYIKGADNGRHIAFDAPSGIHIELHRWFSSSGNRTLDEALDGMLYAGLERRELRDIYGFSVPLLPETENGLVLLGHINQHISSGLGLRQIVDWMMYVRQCLDDGAWQDGFARAADSIGMRTLAETVTLMCVKHLGLSGITWCDSADGGLADELMEYILTKGNFGRKQERGSRDTLTVMHCFRSPISAIRYLHKGGMCHWKAAQKHRILRPFAWIYQIGHIIRKGLQRKVRITKFFGEARQSRYESGLLERLKVTRK